MEVDTAAAAGASCQWHEGVARFVAVQDVVVVSPQHASRARGEPDLSFEETATILQQALLGDPAGFLRRWGQHLRPQHLEHFRTIERFDVQHHLSQLQLAGDVHHMAKQTRNRRLRHMQQLLREGSYFSEEEMSRRRPALYSEYVGQHITPDEAAAKASATNDTSWSDQLLTVVLNKDTRERREKTRAREGWPKQGEEVDRDKQQGNEKGNRKEAASNEEEFDTDSDEEQDDSQVERIRLRGEFERLMREAFLAGEDTEFFNYSAIDNNDDLDDLETRARDEEEKYFDDD